jgi:hypothetical protein
VTGFWFDTVTGQMGFGPVEISFIRRADLWGEVADIAARSGRPDLAEMARQLQGHYNSLSGTLANDPDRARLIMEVERGEANIGPLLPAIGLNPFNLAESVNAKKSGPAILWGLLLAVTLAGVWMMRKRRR